MKQLKKYIFKTYSNTFFPIFFILFIITSVVFLIKIARLTSIIQIDFLELLIMYSFTLPKILFYILPISIFISITLTIAKLSNDYEIVVINSFGLNPIKLIKIFIPHIILVTSLLLLISMVLVPKTNLLNLQFIENKKAEAQFNINPSEFGQKFGEWFIYVNDKENKLYKNVVLFKTNQNDNDTNFIISQSANPISNQQNNLNLILTNGNGININNTIKQVEFETMTISNSIKKINVIDTLDDLLFYWKNIKQNESLQQDFLFNLFYSTFNLLSLLLFICIGFFNPRYEKNRSTTISIIVSIFYVFITHKLSKEYSFNILLITFPILWLLGSYYYYKVKIKSYY